MSERPTYAWSYALSWGLTISGGTLAVVSVLAYFLPATMLGAQSAKLLCVFAFAAMVGFSVACANCCAGAAMHAVTAQTASKSYWSTFWPAIGCMFGFCVTTGIGVHLGWALMTQGVASHDLPDARLVNGAAIFIALAKPGMNWIIQGRRGMDKDAADAAEVIENARLDARHKTEIESRNSNVTHLRPKTGRTIAGAAAAASLTLLGAPRDASAEAPQTQQDAHRVSTSDAPEVQTEAPLDAPTVAPQTRSRRSVGRKPTDYETRVCEAKRLLTTQPNMSNRQIAKQTRISPSKVDRLARDMTPLRGVA